MAGTEGGGSQGLHDHVQQCSCSLLELWGALVLLKGLVPALPDEVSSSLCERRGVRAGWLLQVILSAWRHYCTGRGMGLSAFPRASPGTQAQAR